MISFFIAVFVCGIDFCFQAWHQAWCSDFLMIYLLCGVLYTDTWTVDQKVHSTAVVFLSALQDFFIYGVFGLRLVWILPFVAAVRSIAHLFRYRQFVLSSLLVISMMLLQTIMTLFFLGSHETLYEWSMKLTSSLLFMFLYDLMKLIKMHIVRKT